MINDTEILAPAGSFDSLKAAVCSGADAVYFAGMRFGARKNAVNLSDEEIISAVRFAHLRGVKVYVTVNILVFDSELDDVWNFLKFCYENDVDGVIVQDLGIAYMIKKCFPNFRMHASTQMTVHNLSGVRMAEKLGFKRVVLSRELSFDEIKHITSASDCEIEVFVHGALCMCYSGQCLFSSFLGGRSGNRGYCAQPCRLPYTLLDSDLKPVSENNKYLLSLKDLCLAKNIKDLADIGVKSFKIEGRMKGEAYVSAASGIYSKCKRGEHASSDEIKLLENIFSREGFTDGYYTGSCGRNMLVYNKNNDDIYSSVTDEMTEKAKSYALVGAEKKTLINALFVLKKSKPVHFEITYDGRVFSADGRTDAADALNAPTDKVRILSQLEKLGDTVFEYGKLNIDADDGLYVPVKEINSVRRECIGMLEDYICKRENRDDFKNFAVIKPKLKSAPKPVYTASVLNEEQARAAYDLGFEKIYVPYGVYLENKDFYDGDGDVFCVKLPPIEHDGKNCRYEKIGTETVCITNIGQICSLPDDINVHADYRLNIYNSLCIKNLSACGVKSVCLSPELTASQMADVSKYLPAEALVYGRVSLMTVRNCIVKSAADKCGCKSDPYFLLDRKKALFPVYTDKSQCTNTVYNSVPTVMSDRMREIMHCGLSMYRFDFTTEKPSEMENILNMYENGRKPDFPFTRGHYYNGVE